MRDLMKAELHRFYVGALILAIFHCGLLIFLDRVEDTLQQPLLVYRLYLGVLSLVSLFFGAYQMSSYTQPVSWIQLMHRPTSGGRIGGAIMLAGLTLLALVVALPVALLLPFHAAFGNGMVESRHMLMPVGAFLVTATAYLIGVYIRVGPRIRAVAALLLLIWLYHTDASGIAAIFVQALAAITAFLLALGNFRPDPEARMALPARLLGHGMVLLTIAVVGTFILRFVMQLGLMLLGAHPLNGIPPAGGLVEASRSEGAALLVAGLEDANDQRAKFWSEQVQLSEVATLTPELTEAPQRFSITNLAGNSFDDDPAKLTWTFSHGDMRYSAIDQATRKRAIKIAHSPRLQAPPIASGDGKFIVAGAEIYSYDPGSRRFSRRVSLPQQEVFAAGPKPQWDMVALITDRKLRFYDQRAVTSGASDMLPMQEIALPQPIGDLIRIDMIELLDGYLISFLYGNDVANGRGQPVQELWEVSASQPTRVGIRRLDADYPAVIRYADIWFAPLLNQVGETASELLAPPNPLTRHTVRDISAVLLVFALIVHTAAGFLCWLWAERVQLSSRKRIVWSLAGVAFGLPAPIALYLFEPRRTAC